eukprot:1648878-Pleurochrysis_carterae.AAC.1
MKWALTYDAYPTVLLKHRNVSSEQVVSRQTHYTASQSLDKNVICAHEPENLDRRKRPGDSNLSLFSRILIDAKLHVGCCSPHRCGMNV